MWAFLLTIYSSLALPMLLSLSHDFSTSLLSTYTKFFKLVFHHRLKQLVV